jgi:hypothetical protein
MMSLESLSPISRDIDSTGELTKAKLSGKGIGKFISTADMNKRA